MFCLHVCLSKDVRSLGTGIKDRCELPSGYWEWFFVCLFFACLFVCLLETGFLSLTVLAVLEIAFVDQAGLELTEIHLPLPPECWD